MKKAYVIGTNVSKSLSPTIFNYWFKKYKIQSEYKFIEIGEENFNKKISIVLQEEGLCGLNITIPFKEKITKHLNIIDKHAQQIGAVNCVTITKDGLEGTNTDWIGLKNQ